LQFGKSRDRHVGYFNSNYSKDLDKWRALTSYSFTICGYAIS
jgi:hypothetical protein